MASLLARKLIVVTGKGGAGKSTIAGALGLLGAGRGLRTIVAELGEQSRLQTLLGQLDGHEPKERRGAEIELERNLWSVSLDPDRALIEWLRTLGGRVSARLLASSSTFQYFAAAAPGAKELVSLVKVRELCERRKDAYDLVVLDAPATGHALAMLASPRTFSAIVRSGPLASHAGEVQKLLCDERRSAYVAVTHASGLAVDETLELEEGLRGELDRDLDAVIVNGALPRRFSHEELAQVGGLAQKGVAARLGIEPSLADAAAQAARSVHDRARMQRNQIARLQRGRVVQGAPAEVLTVPFAFAPRLEHAHVERIARRLEHGL